MATHLEAGRKLTSADYLLIEEEHAQLEKILSDIRDTCCNLDNLAGCENCSSERLATCQGRLPSFVHNVVELAASHFDHEELIMLNRPNATPESEHFRSHSAAHADIVQTLEVIASGCYSLAKQDKTAESYRQFYKKLSALFEEHDRIFDEPFIQSTKA